MRSRRPILLAVVILAAVLIAVMHAMEAGKLPRPRPKAPPRIATARTRELSKLTNPRARNWELSPNLKVVKTRSGLKYQDMKLGSGDSAMRGDSVLVDYVGFKENGFKFDSSFAPGRLPLSFRIGARQVIRGWEEGVTGMKIGGVRRLVIPPDLAYGVRGYPPAIESNARLIFVVRVLDVRHKAGRAETGRSTRPSAR